MREEEIGTNGKKASHEKETVMTRQGKGSTLYGVSICLTRGVPLPLHRKNGRRVPTGQKAFLLSGKKRKGSERKKGEGPPRSRLVLKTNTYSGLLQRSKKDGIYEKTGERLEDQGGGADLTSGGFCSGKGGGLGGGEERGRKVEHCLHQFVVSGRRRKKKKMPNQKGRGN